MRNNYNSFQSGQHFTITSPGETVSPGEGTVIIMERGAFGSGEHETTRSCLETISGIDMKGIEKILDFGSGTGILAIAALLSGAGTAWCIDIEDAALDCGRRNCALNGVTARVRHFNGLLRDFTESRFNLVFANIYADILMDVAEDLVAKTASGGELILSGIPWEDNFTIRQRYQHLGCRIVKNSFLEDFSTLHLCKD